MVFVLYDLQFRPSSAYDSPYWTTNAGAPVYNNDSSLTVGPRGIYTHIYVYILTLLLCVSLVLSSWCSSCERDCFTRTIYYLRLFSTCLSSLFTVIVTSRDTWVLDLGRRHTCLFRFQSTVLRTSLNAA
jgi:predicted membrane channel-forming protein YqfA (hemolysin III family)